VSPRHVVGYTFFLLTTATLFIRPGEILARADGWPVFQVLILAALGMSLPAVMQQLSWGNLVRFPALLCVLAMTVAIAISRARLMDWYGARTGAADFSKVVVYLILLVALVDSVERLRGFLKFTIWMIVAMSVLAVLGYYGIVHVHSMQAVIVRGDGGYDAETGGGLVFRQLQASGIFSDPNDFALILVLAFMGTLYLISEAQTLSMRFFWCMPAAMLAFSFALTKSRGGLLSLLAGVVVWLVSRFGLKRAIFTLVFVLPLLFAAFAGRQTNINLDANDTAQSRIRLWRDGIGFIESSPVFGIGYNLYSERTDNVAHNSYLHCYAELGFLGGTFFFGAFVLTLVSVASPEMQRRLSWLGEFILPPTQYAQERPVLTRLPIETEHLRSSLLAIGAAYAVGLFSLSRSYACSTYLMLGMLISMSMLIASQNPSMVARFSGRLVGVIVGVSGCWLVFLYVFVKLVVRAAGHT